MRPYYVGNTQKRLAKLTPANRRRVLEYAKAEALRRADSGDIDRHLFAVRPCHLVDCGFSGSQPCVSVIEHFIDHLVAHNAAQHTYMSRGRIRRLMKDPATFVYWHFVHYKAGWNDQKALAAL